uniref:Uncharacterized protein n=1 Tax=Moniliophthora roreri TaxID=221103 RepID=A0A0W0FZB4_MONRR
MSAGEKWGCVSEASPGHRCRCRGHGQDHDEEDEVEVGYGGSRQNQHGLDSDRGYLTQATGVCLSASQNAHLTSITLLGHHVASQLEIGMTLSLRLINRRFNKIVEPVLWASLPLVINTTRDKLKSGMEIPEALRIISRMIRKLDIVSINPEKGLDPPTQPPLPKDTDGIIEVREPELLPAALLSLSGLEWKITDFILDWSYDVVNKTFCSISSLTDFTLDNGIYDRTSSFPLDEFRHGNLRKLTVDGNFGQYSQ